MSSSQKMRIEGEVSRVTEKYTSDNQRSFELYKEACVNLPGGNTRSILFNDPFPIFMKEGRGNKLWDVDAHVYTDMMGEMTAGLYGHSHPIIREAIINTFDSTGICLGANSIAENNLACEIRKRFPSMELLRFCNSGTEANMNLLTVAKYYTKKSKIVAFYGGYHGGSITFAHGNTKTNIDSNDFLVAEYNNIESFDKVLNSSDDIAAVIVEGMQGAGGAIPGTIEFMKHIEANCKEKKILLILDEVMTSRLGPGGLQKALGVVPDLTSLGKYLGGGLNFGAFGGRADILSCYDPRSQGSISHSGTFNNNTLSLAAGLAGLTKIFTQEVAITFNARGDKLRRSFQDAAAGTKLSVTGIGSLMNFHFTEDGQFTTAADNDREIKELKSLFWMDLLTKGFWLANRGMVAMICTLTEEEISSFEKTVIDWMERRRELIEIK